MSPPDERLASPYLYFCTSEAVFRIFSREKLLCYYLRRCYLHSDFEKVHGANKNSPSFTFLYSPFSLSVTSAQPCSPSFLFSLRFTFPPAGGTECSGSAEREFLSLRPTRVVWPFELNFIISVVLCMHTQLLLILPLQRVEICAAHQTQLLHNVYSNWINDTKIFILPKHRGCFFIKSYFH